MSDKLSKKMIRNEMIMRANSGQMSLEQILEDGLKQLSFLNDVSIDAGITEYYSSKEELIKKGTPISEKMEKLIQGCFEQVIKDIE